jgi:hypothetical protein
MNSDFLYPVNFNFKVPKTGVKLFFDILKSGENSAELVDSINGGLFFEQESSPLFFSYTGYLPVGNYFGRLTFKDYPAFVNTPTGPTPNPDLFTEIKFKEKIFTGYEGKGLAFEIIRSGFTEYPLGIIVRAYFEQGKNNPYPQVDYFNFDESGFFIWESEIRDSLLLNLPVFNNNKWENNAIGKLDFSIDTRGFPSGSIFSGNNVASFIIIDDDIPECVKQCYTSSSTSTQGLGLDLFFEN